MKVSWFKWKQWDKIIEGFIKCLHIITRLSMDAKTSSEI